MEEQVDIMPEKDVHHTVALVSGGVIEAVSLFAHGGTYGVLTGLVTGGVIWFMGKPYVNSVRNRYHIAREAKQQSSKNKGKPASKGGFADRWFSSAPMPVAEETAEALPPDYAADYAPENAPQWNQDGHPEWIQLAPGLEIPPDDIIGKAVLIIGQRRSGKTTLGARLAEEMSEHFVPMFVPDYHGDYASATELFPRGVLVKAPGTFTGKEQCQCVELTVDRAEDLGYRILELGWQVVLDMPSYDLTEAVDIVIGVIMGMFQWAKHNPGKLTPCEVYLDEAQALLSQDPSESVVQDPDQYKALLRAYSNVVAEGGKFGLTPVILTQRFAQTNKKVIGQSEVIFVLRQTNENDLKRCANHVNAKTASMDDISGFAKGQGVYIASDGSQGVYQFYQRQSDGSRSATPRVSKALKFRQMPMGVNSGYEDEDGDDDEGYPYEPVSRRGIPPQQVRPEPPVPINIRRARKAEYADALKVYREICESEGVRPGRPRLRKELQSLGLECSSYQAGELLDQIKQNFPADDADDDVADAADEM